MYSSRDIALISHFLRKKHLCLNRGEYLSRFSLNRPKFCALSIRSQKESFYGGANVFLVWQQKRSLETVNSPKLLFGILQTNNRRSWFFSILQENLSERCRGYTCVQEAIYLFERLKSMAAKGTCLS